MKNSRLVLISLAAASVTGSSLAAVIDNSVITDFIDQTPGFNVSRPLGTTITGDDAVYLVGTMNFDVEALAGSFIEANMGNGTNFIAGFGNAFGQTTIVIAQNGTRASTTESFTVGVPVQLVMKFNQTTGDTALWVNPNLATPEALNTPNAAVNIPVVMGSTFNSVIFRGGDFSAPASVVDFSDFAVYFAGDTPFIPEPSSLMLLAVGGLVAARRRR